MDRRGSMLFILGGGVAAVAGWKSFRKRGVSVADSQRRLPGDELVARPRWVMTISETIRARPEFIWPWLVQIGYQRGGLYSYDWLDRLFGILDRPSADRVLPEYQQLAAGDVIPIGSGPNWPVAAVDPLRSLVLAPDAPGFQISWAFVLEPSDADTTRLVTRVRADFDRTRAAVVLAPLIDSTSFVMTRRMLQGIRERAERLAQLPPDSAEHCAADTAA